MACWWLFIALACSGPAVEPLPAPTPAPAAQAPPPEPPAPEPLAPTPLAEPTEVRYAATQVQIAWAGAIDAPPSVTRTREEARAEAEAIRARADGGEALEDLARAHSDAPSAARGGHLGTYLTGTMVPELERAVASVPVGALAPLVETPFGWHVLRRDAVVDARAAHVLIGFAGAWRSTATRSRDEALARANEAVAALGTGRPFDEVARAYSEDATAEFGGDLGTVSPGQMIPDFEDALFALAPGATSGVVETPYGFHVIRRLP